MNRDDAISALKIYKKSGSQVMVLSLSRIAIFVVLRPSN
jgi:hypothetical protein